VGGKATADPSATLGMTKGRAALTSAAVTGDGQSGGRLSSFFIPLGGPQAHDNSVEKHFQEGSWVGKQLQIPRLRSG